MSTPVLRALAGKPGAAKRALQEQYGESASADSSGDGVATNLTTCLEACFTPSWQRMHGTKLSAGCAPLPFNFFMLALAEWHVE